MKKRDISVREFTTFYFCRPRFIFSQTVQTREGKRLSRYNNQSFGNLEKKAIKKGLSEQSQRKIRHAVEWLIEQSQQKRVFDKDSGKNFWFKVNFITVTIPSPEVSFDTQEERDKYWSVRDISACEMWSAYLTYLRNCLNLRNYVWKKETTAKGEIHFHLTSDTFLHYKQLRQSWNKYLTRWGFSDEFYKKHGHRDCNSTDVHSVLKVNNITGYIIKYMAKESEGRRIPAGRLWGCSYSLAYSNRLILDIPSEFAGSFSYPVQCFSKKWEDLYSEPDYFGNTFLRGTCYYFDQPILQKLPDCEIKQVYQEYVQKLRINTPDLFIQTNLN